LGLRQTSLAGQKSCDEVEVKLNPWWGCNHACRVCSRA